MESGLFFFTLPIVALTSLVVLVLAVGALAGSFGAIGTVRGWYPIEGKQEVQCLQTLGPVHSLSCDWTHPRKAKS